jgi:hypothetical protein
VVPTVVNGKVYVGGLKQLYVFGLLPSLSVSAGNNQSAVAGTALPVGLELQATDAYSHTGIPGISVSCKDGGASGSLSNPTGVTDASGNFTTNYTLPVKAKTITITCIATGYNSAVLTETAIAGPATVIKQSSGNKQTAPINTALPQPLVALVEDAHFNPIQGAAVTFSDGGKGGRFGSATAITDSTGHAQTSYTTPGTAGVVKITASTGSLKPASFTVTVTAQ